VGLFRDMLGGMRMSEPVRGTAQVVSCQAYRGDGTWQNCRMQLVVQADGVPPTSVEHRELIHNARWPVPGMTLPATVDRADPTRLKIEWDEVETSADRSRRTAEGAAAAMRGEAGAPGGFAGNVNVVNLSGRDLSQLSDEQKTKLRMFGIDVDAMVAAQGQSASPPPPPPPQSGVDADLDRLERLVKLRDSGALTQEEFETQKRAILGD
jgi:hypothetical protein